MCMKDCLTGNLYRMLNTIKRLEKILIFFLYKYLNCDFKLLDHSVIESRPLSSVLALSQTAFGAVSILGTLMC